MKKNIFALILLIVLFPQTLLAQAIKPGFWKFILKTENADIPFIIEFKSKDKTFSGILHNGEEKIPLSDMSIQDKNLSIPLDSYEIVLDLKIKDENNLQGHLIRLNKNPVVKTPVIAAYGIKKRFVTKKNRPATISIHGKWSLEMTNQHSEKNLAIGTFIQNKNKFKGSILTPTGDYRYIQGHVFGQEFEGASFDGVYNYLIKGSIKDGKMQAQLLSNTVTKLSGVRDDKATLPDPLTMTQLPELKFIFPDLKGQSVALTHEKFKNRPVVVQIFGSWCPNCMDEMKYLIPWYQANSKRGIEVIALAFERSQGIEEATRQLLKVQMKYQVPYPILQAGSTSEDKPADKIVGLKNFVSFPTTIFLNKKHEVIKVHAGFSGPSTGEYYMKWQKEFNLIVDELLRK